jgi:hypothetical protein
MSRRRKVVTALILLALVLAAVIGCFVVDWMVSRSIHDYYFRNQ